MDYIDSIKDDPKLMNFLNNFIEEWLGARLNHEGRKFHKSKKDRKKIWDANNARNRDIMSIHNRLDNFTGDIADIIEQNRRLDNPEDYLIDIIDNKKRQP